MIIESLENDKVKLWKKIRTSKYINEYGKYIIEGYHLVEEALKTGYVLELILLKDIDYDTKNITTHYVSEKVMKSISLLPSVPPIMAVVKVNENKELGKKIVILDDVQDPGNIGTIIRNAVAFNASSVILSSNSVSPYNDKLIRASQGMCFHINVIKSDIKTLIKELKKEGLTIYATCLDGSIEMSEVNFNKEYAVIFGNEGEGISKEIQELSDVRVRIDMNPSCESLNVGVSSGIILYNLMER